VGVHGSLGLGGISNKTFSLGESNIRRGGTVTLVVGNDFDTVILPDSDTGVGGSKIDSDGFSGYSCSKEILDERKTIVSQYSSFGIAQTLPMDHCRS